MNYGIFVGAKVRIKGKGYIQRQGKAVVVSPNKFMCLDDLGPNEGAFRHIVPEGVTEWMTWNVQFPGVLYIASYADFNLELIRVPTPWEQPTRKLSTEPSTANIDYHLTRPKRTLRRT